MTPQQRGQVRRAVTRLLTEEHREFPSKSSPGTIYRAVILRDGHVQCNCRGWTIKRDGRPRQCVHTHALLAGRLTRTDGEYFFLKETP